MPKRIIIENADGTVGIMCPAPEALKTMTLEQIIQKGLKADAVSYEVVDTSVIFEDRTFRNAWTKCPTNKLKVDMPKARGLHKDKLRFTRDKKLQELDVAVLRAMEINATAEIEVIKNKKQLLRDMPEDPGFEAASTPEELKAFTPDCLKD